MGGNSSYNKTLDRVPGWKRTHHEYHDRVDGHKILLWNSNPKHLHIPENSNSESPVYLCARKTASGGIEIASVGIYKKHKCVSHIDLSFDKDGNLKPFAENGKGSHFHKLEMSQDGKVGRKTHDKNNVFPIPPEFSELVKHIAEYNIKHR